MRVTNEQAKELLKSDTVTLMSIADIRMLSADLLEARDLIKEIRGNLINGNGVDAVKIWLEKTKEYAE